MTRWSLRSQFQWKLRSADKSAFLQADSIENEVGTYVVLNRDIRRRLARMIELRDHQIMRILKPAFGDLRAPRQWYTTADRVQREELNFYRHKLDNKCLYMSTRTARDDDPCRILNVKGAYLVVDGIIGAHVDDVTGGGEADVHTKVLWHPS